MIVKIHRPQEKKHINKSLLLAVLIIMLIITATTATSVFAASNMITTSVEVAGETVTVSSFSSDPYTIIEKAGVKLNNFDEVALYDFDTESKDNKISVKKAFEVTIRKYGAEPETYLVAGTVSDALKNAGIKITDKDYVNCPLDKEIIENMQVVISKAIHVTVFADGKQRKIKTNATTVEKLLKKEKISLSDDDIINHKKTAKLKDGMNIRIKRVEYREELVTEKLEFKTITKNSDELYIGQTKVVTEGKNGKRVSYCLCRYVDSKFADKAIIYVLETKEPTDKVVLVGTKRYTNPATSKRVISELTPPYTIELDKNGRPVHYKRLLTGKATAYYGGGITATGQRAMPGRIAVNPRQIPYGTRMYIVSSDGRYVYGYCVASDTGGFVKNSNTIADLYFHSYNECVQFGRRSVEIYILD